MVDKEFAEVERYFVRITDPEQHEKIKLEVEYLDEMIKQESLRIHKLNLNQTRFKRLDFVQNEVEKERKMVQLEDDIARTKLRLMQMEGCHVRNQEVEIATDEKIMQLLEQHDKLAAQSSKIQGSPTREVN